MSLENYLARLLGLALEMCKEAEVGYQMAADEGNWVDSARRSAEVFVLARLLNDAREHGFTPPQGDTA
jgi:hypothetical protein